jgi:hypothetical protein
MTLKSLTLTFTLTLTFNKIPNSQSYSFMFTQKKVIQTKKGGKIQT